MLSVQGRLKKALECMICTSFLQVAFPPLLCLVTEELYRRQVSGPAEPLYWYSPTSSCPPSVEEARLQLFYEVLGPTRYMLTGPVKLI